MGAEVGADPPAAGGEHDPDAPWKPGYEWSDTGVDGATGSAVEPAVSDGAVDPWSRPAAASVAPPGGTDAESPSEPAARTEASPWSRSAADAAATPFDPEAYRREHRAERPTEPIRPAEGLPLDIVRNTPRSAVTGDVVLVGLGVVAALLVAVVVAVTLRGAIDERPAAAACPVGRCAVQLPSAVDELWSATIDDGWVGELVLGRDWLAFALDGRIEVRSLDTGEVAWRSEQLGSSAMVSALDDVVVAVVPTGTTTAGRALIAFDSETGAQLWRYDATAGGEVGAFEAWLFEVTTSGAEQHLQLIDAATGEPLGGELVLGEVAGAIPFLATERNGRIQLVDLDTGEAAGPRVDAFGLRALTSVGGSVVGFDSEATIVLFDDSGQRADERRFTSDAFGDFAGRAELVGGVPGTDVGIVASGTSIGFRVADGAIEGVWELDGRVLAPEVTDIGPVSLARTVDQETGEVDVSLVDPLTGAIIAVTDPGVTHEVPPVLGRSGYLVGPEAGAAPTVRAFGFDGRQRWSVALSRFATFVADHGHLAVLERGPDESVLRVYG